MNYHGQAQPGVEGGMVLAQHGQWRLLLTHSGEYRIQQLPHDIQLYQGITPQQALARFNQVVADGGPFPNTRGNLGHGGGYR